MMIAAECDRMMRQWLLRKLSLYIDASAEEAAAAAHLGPLG